jgi:hypothetical protein
MMFFDWTADCAPADVLAAVRKMAADPEQHWPLRSYEAGRAVANQMGLRERYDHGYSGQGHTHNDYRATVRFDGKAKRALDKLAELGELVRKGRDFTGMNEAWWFTPAAWQAWDAEQQQKKLAKRQLADRWATVYDLIEQLGYQPVTPASTYYRETGRGTEVTISLAGWEQLLNRDDLVDARASYVASHTKCGHGPVTCHWDRCFRPDGDDEEVQS